MPVESTLTLHTESGSVEAKLVITPTNTSAEASKVDFQIQGPRLEIKSKPNKEEVIAFCRATLALLGEEVPPRNPPAKKS